MEEKEKYEIDGEAFFMQLLDAAAEKFNKMSKLAELAKELSDVDLPTYLGTAIDNIDKFDMSDQVDFLETMTKMFRVSKKMCEKYNIDISEENK